MSRPVLLVLVGPTGSGKSALAHQIALARHGEVISADAFAVYRGFDVGTAKPSLREREEVSYHLIDVAEPSETFSAGRWAEEARAAVEDIVRRARLPIVCGGSGFYISALLDGLPAGKATDAGLRAALKAWSETRPETARRFLAVNDPLSAGRIGPRNMRYTLRALEILLLTGSAASSRRPAKESRADQFRVVKVGLAPERQDLYARIAARVRRMLEEGWDAEVRRLLEANVSVESNAFQAIGYREVAEWVAGRAERSDTEEKIVAATRRLAKRQGTWFTRERGIVWMKPEEARAGALNLLDRVETERSG